MSLTKQLLERAWSLNARDLNQEVTSGLRRLFLDHVAVTSKGSHTESARAAQRAVQVLGGGSNETSHVPLVGTSLVGGPVAAVMANGVAAHSIEYDDVHLAASSHPGAVVFPAAISAAILGGSDAETFLLGSMAGYEVMCRVGRAADAKSQYRHNFHPTGTTGSVGAATTAARVLGLDVNEAISAVGIAASIASGGMSFLVDGAWTKRLHPGLAGSNGLLAAVLASEGFRGPTDGIAGPRGFLETYGNDPHPDELTRGWGERPWEVLQTSIKAHTCCRYKHPAIDALLEIRSQHRVDADQIAAVRIGIPEVAIDIIAEPSEVKRRPRTVVDAQFSMPFGAAIALAYGQATLAEYEETRLNDPQLLHLMDRVVCVPDGDLDEAFPDEWRAWAEVTTSDGVTLRSEVDSAKGDPGNPLSEAELFQKYMSLSAGSYSEQRQADIHREISSLGQESSLGTLLALLSADL